MRDIFFEGFASKKNEKFRCTTVDHSYLPVVRTWGWVPGMREIMEGSALLRRSNVKHISVETSAYGTTSLFSILVLLFLFHTFHFSDRRSLQKTWHAVAG